MHQLQRVPGGDVDVIRWREDAQLRWGVRPSSQVGEQPHPFFSQAYPRFYNKGSLQGMDPGSFQNEAEPEGLGT